MSWQTSSPTNIRNWSLRKSRRVTRSVFPLANYVAPRQMSLHKINQSAMPFQKNMRPANAPATALFASTVFQGKSLALATLITVITAMPS